MVRTRKLPDHGFSAVPCMDFPLAFGSGIFLSDGCSLFLSLREVMAIILICIATVVISVVGAVVIGYIIAAGGAE